ALALPAAIGQPVDSPTRALQDRLCADALQRAVVVRRGRLWVGVRRDGQRLRAVLRDDIDLQPRDGIVGPDRVAAMGAQSRDAREYVVPALGSGAGSSGSRQSAA